jgi:uncharacterized membrane protein
MTTDVSPQQAESNRTITLACYILYAAALISGVTALIAVILNYVKRDDVVGTIYESHFTWQIRTFWYSLLWVVLGWATVWILIGFLVWGAACVWYIYRVVKGWVRMTEGKAMYVV